MTRTLASELLRTKLAESLAAFPGGLTSRDLRIPQVPGKAFAVIGVRRGGKTSFLRHHMAEQVATGKPRESQLLITLEDERLVGMSMEDLGWMIGEHARQFPAVRAGRNLSVYLDEVQVVPGWEKVVRRLVDEGGMELFVSGSSARLLSQEVATSLRGRGMEILVHPFSFRESLRHAGREPNVPWERLGAGDRIALDAAVRTYLEQGGFPEAQGLARQDRLALLKGYVDIMVLRDVIERHTVTNPVALRWLQRHLLATPGGNFSIRKLYDDLRSQGVPVSKDTLHAYLDHLQDAFLVRTAWMHSTSERQRMVNPRKVYPVDTGLIALYERSGRQHQGRSLETSLLLELERRGYSVEWVRTPEGWEVDFLAERPGDPPILIQACLDPSDGKTWAREVRALESAARIHSGATAFLITLDSTPPRRELPSRLQWRSAAEWLLQVAA